MKPPARCQRYQTGGQSQYVPKDIQKSNPQLLILKPGNSKKACASHAKVIAIRRLPWED